MSMGGAETLAPPIFFLDKEFANMPDTLLTDFVYDHLQSRIVTETSHEKTLPYRAFVYYGVALPPGRDPLPSERFCRGGSRSGFKG